MEDEPFFPGIAELLETISSPEPTGGAGAVAALVTAMAAGLLAMASKASPDWRESRAAAAQANTLVRRAAPLAPMNEEAYLEALVALRLPAQLESEVRDATMLEMLVRAAAVPLAIAEVAADVAELATDVAERCDQAFRADAVAAAHLAEGAARACAELVAVNLGVTEEDERLAKARRLVGVAADSARRIRSSGEYGA